MIRPSIESQHRSKQVFGEVLDNDNNKILEILYRVCTLSTFSRDINKTSSLCGNNNRLIKH